MEPVRISTSDFAPENRLDLTTLEDIHGLAGSKRQV